MITASQTHILPSLRKNGTESGIELIYGRDWRVPMLPTTLEEIEALYGPPETILSRSDFRTYQGWMADKIIADDYVFMAAEMGLGKTGATLWAIVNLLNLGIIKNVLIVGPLNVAKYTWVDEIATWDFARRLTFRQVVGDLDQRKAALQRPAQITIVNRENLVWLHQQLPGRQWNFDMLVYDEASRLKRGMKRTKPTQRKDGTLGDKKLSEFGALARHRKQFKKIVELSGTPAPNGLVDLWGPIFLLDGGERLGKSKTAFTNRWFKTDRYTHQVEPFEHSHDQIMDKIKDLFFALREKDYLKLPPLITRKHKIRLAPKIMRKYKELEREMMLEEYDVEAVNRGVLTSKLLQLANGSVYDVDGKDRPLHDEKMAVLDSIVEEAAGHPVLVAYSFKFDLARLKKKYPKARVFGESASDQRDWNAGRIPLMIIHPASAGHGINIQRGGNILVWYGLTWSLELFLQLRKRLHRSGQKRDFVMEHCIIAEGTADTRILPVLMGKETTQDDVMDATKVIV